MRISDWSSDVCSSDLRSFTRELMADAAKDLGTELDWVAVDHWNTDNPHIHVLVRGVASDGTDLVIDRGYISEGLRFRAEERLTLEQIGRAHVCTPVTNAHLVCRLLLEKKNPNTNHT